MYTKIFALLSKHSVAIAILASNIISAIIISRMSSKDKLLQNKIQDTKDTLQVLLQILQKLELLLAMDPAKPSSNSLDSLKGLSLKVILDCKRAMHLISDSQNYLPNTMDTCRGLHDYLSSINLEELDFPEFIRVISGFYDQLNKNIEEEWIDG